MEAQQPAAVVRFQYRPYMKGARKAPAMAPQLTPIAWAMKATLEFFWIMASTAEIMINTTIRARMIVSCFFSSICLTIRPLSRSRVMVEEEVSTREDRVGMEAESTRMMTTAIRKGERLDSMVGMMLSYPSAGTPAALTGIWLEKSRPKPPRK